MARVTLEQLRQAAAKNTDAANSAEKFIKEMIKQIREKWDASTDEDDAGMEALLSQLEANTQTLGRAIAEGTSAQRPGQASTPIVAQPDDEDGSDADQAGGEPTQESTGKSGSSSESGGV